MYKYCFIGAGVSNLLAIHYLIKNNVACDEIILFEKGKPLNDRKCPSINTRCIHCEIECPVISGFGGSSAFYGNKFSYFPSSQKILNYTDRQSTNEALNYLQSSLGYLYDKHFNQFNTSEKGDRKVFFSDTIYQDNYQKIIHYLVNEITGKITVVNRKVDKIKFNNGSFEIYSMGNEYNSKKLIIGTGRSSGDFILEFLKLNQVGYKNNDPDIGFRVEADSRNFSKHYYYQNDPKYKVSSSFGNARSFCAVNKGYIVPVKYKNFYYAEGVFYNEPSQKNNIALMSRINNGPGMDLIAKWAHELNIFFKNKLSAGEIVITNNVLDLKDQMLNFIPYWPNVRYKELMSKLLDNMIVKNNIFTINKKTNNIINIYAPSIDNYWISPEVLKNLETKIEGLFFIGDIIGVSRGIIQAMFSGLIWSINEVNGVYGKIPEKNNHLWHYSG